jgi:hypothetical protein
LRQSYIAVIFLLMLIVCSMQVVSSQTAQDFAVLAEPKCSRTVYLEPSYQVYIDEISLPTSFSSFNVSFLLLDAINVYGVYAYGPQNQTLQTSAYWNSTSHTYTVNVNTTDVNSFKLLTIYHEMALSIGNFTVYVNFFPIVDNASSASTSIYLPAGAQLLYYDESYLSNSTSGERTLISGSKELTPSNDSFGTVVYNGNYSLVEADSFSRVIRITPSAILMEETIKIRNSGIYTLLTNVTLNVSKGAIDLKAMDTIGYLNFNQSGQTITVFTRLEVYYNEYFEFTLLYSLPPSSLMQIVDGKSVISGDVLPEWFNMPAKQVSLTIFMPPESSDAQMVGGQITEKEGSLVADASYVYLTPYTNEVFSLSFTPSPYASYVGPALIIIIIVAVVVGAFLYRKFKKGAKEVTPPPAAPAKPAPPPPPEKKKEKVPPKGKRR